VTTVEGTISVKAVLTSQSRDMETIYIENGKKSRDISFIIHEAERRKVRVEFISADRISEITQGKTHGGVVAAVGERKKTDIEELFNVENPFIALLEGIEDPYNFGDSVRSLYAAGATGIIVPERNWLSAAGTVVKSSAGATEFLPIAMTDNLGDAIKEAKKHGITVYCAERRDSISLYEADLKKPIIMAIGGELRGLSKQVTDNADKNLFIPYGSAFRNALSAASASAVCGFEVMRQRNCTK